MEEAIMLSVRGQWIAKMAEGIKLEEVRKSKPRIPTPFKCYLYCSLFGDVLLLDGRPANGFVVGEFICDAVNEYSRTSKDVARLSGMSCVPATELHHYFGRRATVDGWHISELQFYDKFLPITAFKKLCPDGLYCESCAMFDAHKEICGNAARVLQKPPQSWCYVEALV